MNQRPTVPSDARGLRTRWQQFSLRKKGLTLIAMPLAAMLCAGGFFLVAHSSEADAQRWVQHTLEVKGEVEYTQRLVSDATSSRRTYLLTGEESLLGPYRRAETALPRAVDRIGSLVSDNPLQSERVARHLRLLINDYLQQASANSQPADASQGLREQLSAVDDLVDQIRDLTTAMGTEEDRLLELREQHAESTHRVLLYGIVATLVLGLLIAGGAVWAFSGGMATRIEQLVENTARLEQEQPLRKHKWSQDELGRLGCALQHASELLASRRDELVHTNAELKREISQRARVEFENDQIMNNSPDVICTISAGGRFVRISRASEQVWGYTPEELAGRSYMDLVYPEDHEKTRTAAATITAGTPVTNFQNRYVRKDGTIVPIVWSAAWSDKLQIMFCVARDASERDRIEQALRASEERFRFVTHSLGEAIISADKNGRIVFWNPAATNVFGYTEQEALGMFLTTIMPGRYPMAHKHGMERFQKAAERRASAGTLELEGLHKDGHEFPIELSISTWRTSEGEFFTGVVRDVTARRKAQEELLTAKEAAEGANRAKSEFLANMSHEIRTPMNGIIGMTDLALDTELNRTQREYLEMVKYSADSLLSVINDILDFSKIEAGKLSLEAVPFDLRASLEKTLKTLGIRADRKGLELTCRIEPEVPEHVVGDTVRVRQILINLIDNAIKFTENGEINLTVKRVAGQNNKIVLHFSVKDTGIGIAPDKREKIFAAFSQADSSTMRTYGGTGLGLTISSRLVEQMGGRLVVDGAPGQGSTFHFMAEFEHATEAPASTITLKRDLENLRVLIVDDNATNRLILRDMLLNWRMRPSEAASAHEALAELMAAAAKAEPFSLVLVDALMPEIDGFALAEKIKNTPALSGAILMMLSSAGRAEQSQKCKDCGLTGCLTKPITQSELLNAILTVFSSHETIPALPAQISLAKGGGGLRILAVDDNAVNRSVAQGILSGQGYHVTVAENGREAVELCASEEFDLILMDVQMPLLDGFGATAEIHHLEATKERKTPIIAMTAHAMAGDREKCLVAGMDGYVSKPLNKQELIETVLAFGADILQTGSVNEKNDLLARFDGDVELLEQISEIFASEAPGLINKLNGAIKAGDSIILKQTAHTLIGSLGAFGADRAVTCARELEALAETKSFEPAQRVLDQLRNEVDTLQSRLAAVRT